MAGRQTDMNGGTDAKSDCLDVRITRWVRRPRERRAGSSGRIVAPGARGERIIMGITFPGESAEYRATRDALLEREVALRREMDGETAELVLEDGPCPLRVPRCSTSVGRSIATAAPRAPCRAKSFFEVDLSGTSTGSTTATLWSNGDDSPEGATQPRRRGPATRRGRRAHHDHRLRTPGRGARSSTRPPVGSQQPAGRPVERTTRPNPRRGPGRAQRRAHGSLGRLASGRPARHLGPDRRREWPRR